MARKFGKDDDPLWVARAISPCFAEEALRWHISLSKDVRNNWEALEEALVMRFPAPQQRPMKETAL